MLQNKNESPKEKREMLNCVKFELLITSRVSIHTFEAGIIFISLNKQSNLNLICAHTRASQLLFYEV